MNYGIPQPNPLRMQSAQQPMQQGAPQQAGAGWPSVGQALGGIFSKDLLPMYLGMAMGGTKNAQAQLASQGAQGANELELSRNQMAQQQSQFDANLGLQRQELGAMERYKQAQLDLERQNMAFKQQSYADEQRRLDENPFTKKIQQIGEIPDQYLGGADAAPVVRQKIIDSMFKINETERSFADMVEGESNLRKEINALPEVKEANVALKAFDRIVQGGNTNSGPGDIAMIFSFMKMLDPTSVVRESEYATVENAAGVPERVRMLFNRALNGERLSADQRAQIIDAATNQVSVYTDTLNGVRQRYVPITQSYGYNTDRVVPSVPQTAQKPDLAALRQRYGLD